VVSAMYGSLWMRSAAENQRVFAALSARSSGTGGSARAFPTA
jgi:hypothetical protein